MFFILFSPNTKPRTAQLVLPDSRHSRASVLLRSELSGSALRSALQAPESVLMSLLVGGETLNRFDSWID